MPSRMAGVFHFNLDNSALQASPNGLVFHLACGLAFVKQGKGFLV
jgi:hypothetical protein